MSCVCGMSHRYETILHFLIATNFPFHCRFSGKFSSSSLIHDTKLRENRFLFAQFFNGKLRRKCENLSKWKIFSVTNTALLTFEWLSWISCNSLALTSNSLTYMSKILSIFIQKSSQKGKRKKENNEKICLLYEEQKKLKKKKRKKKYSVCKEEIEHNSQYNFSPASTLHHFRLIFYSFLNKYSKK